MSIPKEDIKRLLENVDKIKVKPRFPSWLVWSSKMLELCAKSDEEIDNMNKFTDEEKQLIQDIRNYLKEE